MADLNAELLKYLSKKLGKEPSTIRKDVSLLKRQHARCTQNAVAHIYAQRHKLSALRFLNDDDKATLPNLQIEPPVKIQQKLVTPRKKPIVHFHNGSSDYFIDGHFKELSKAYSNSCYTCANILARKIIENLIIDILRKKFPEANKQNKELYYDTVQHRYKDFSIILKNLFDKRGDFSIDGKKIIERLVPKVKKMKDDANDKTHSWFYLVSTKDEFDNLDLNSIFALIAKLETNL